MTGVYHQYGGIKKRTITLAVVAARPPAIKKAERKNYKENSG
jgi:hypothetical protein